MNTQAQDPRDPSVKKAPVPLLESLSEKLGILKDRLENIAGRSDSLSSRLTGPAPPQPTAVDSKDIQRCGALVGAMENTIDECHHLAIAIQDNVAKLEELG